MNREVLVHLNVTVPADDARTADEIAEGLMAALHVGIEGGPTEVAYLVPEVALAEEI